MSYRDKFKSPESVCAYEETEYGQQSASTLLWAIEQHILDSICDRWLGTNSSATYLDFACGTGRILAYLGPRMASSVGIDVSEQMLSVARTRIGNAKLLCKDISDESIEVEGAYDVITAFRFFSNAEDALRRKVLAALYRRMHANSILIAHTHTNPLSYKLVTWPYHEMRRAMGQEIHARYLTLSKLRMLLKTAGLVPIAVIGYGFIPGRLLGTMGPRVMTAIESLLAHQRMLRWFGVNQLVICRKGQ